MSFRQTSPPFYIISHNRVIIGSYNGLSSDQNQGGHIHYDVIKWEHCPRYWPFVRGIHRSPVNSPHKGQ